MELTYAVGVGRGGRGILASNLDRDLVPGAKPMEFSIVSVLTAVKLFENSRTGIRFITFSN